MPLWNIEFYPAQGERYSPIDILNAMCTPKDLASIMEKLKFLQEFEMASWPSSWVKSIEGVYQVRQGDFRVYFGLVKRTLVVCHACRKVSQQARPQDIKRAKENFKYFLAEIGND